MNWFPALQATLDILKRDNVNFILKAAGTDAAHRRGSMPVTLTGHGALQNK